MKLKPLEKRCVFPAAYMPSSCRLFQKKWMAFAIFGPRVSLIYEMKS